MIRTRDDGEVRVVTIDRPERRNALTWEALDELEAAVDAADTPVVYLLGAGEAFCAGADFGVVSDLDASTASTFAERGQAVARAIETYDGAVVAGIDGAARGGGVELALACDIRVATPVATFAETGARLGLFGAWGGTARLPTVVGMGNALDIGLSGRVIDAETALRMGLVSRVTEDPRAVADEIASNDTDAVQYVKARTRDDDPVARQEEREAKAFADLLKSFEPE